VRWHARATPQHSSGACGLPISRLGAGTACAHLSSELRCWRLLLPHASSCDNRGNVLVRAPLYLLCVTIQAALLLLYCFSLLKHLSCLPAKAAFSFSFCRLRLPGFLRVRLLPWRLYSLPLRPFCPGEDASLPHVKEEKALLHLQPSSSCLPDMPHLLGSPCCFAVPAHSALPLPCPFLCPTASACSCYAYRGNVSHFQPLYSSRRLFPTCRSGTGVAMTSGCGGRLLYLQWRLDHYVCATGAGGRQTSFVVSVRSTCWCAAWAVAPVGDGSVLCIYSSRCLLQNMVGGVCGLPFASGFHGPQHTYPVFCPEEGRGVPGKGALCSKNRRNVLALAACAHCAATQRRRPHALNACFSVYLCHARAAGGRRGVAAARDGLRRLRLPPLPILAFSTMETGFGDTSSAMFSAAASGGAEHCLAASCFYLI